MRVKYCVKLNELDKLPFKEKTLVALIGDEAGPKYGVYVEKYCEGSLNCGIITEDKDGKIFISAIYPLAKLKEHLLEEINELMDEDEEEEKVVYYCNNPKCVEYGEVAEPLMETNGVIVCPSCGQDLDTELLETGISTERMREIAQNLLHCLSDMIDTLEDFGMEEDLYSLCCGYDVETDEIDELLEMEGL